MKGQAAIIAGVVFVVILFVALIPFLIITMTTPSYNVQGSQSASQFKQAKDLELFEIESGNPKIVYGITSNGADYLNFTFLHGFYPLQIVAIYYFNGTAWVPAYPGNLTVSSNTLIYLFTPPYYSGPIDIVTSYDNQIMLYPVLPGGLEYTNLYTVDLYSPTQTGTLIINKGGKVEYLLQSGSTETVTLTSQQSFAIYNDTEIVVPNATSLPPLIGPNELVALPNGSAVIFPKPINGIEAIKIVKAYATIEIPSGVILQKITHATALPLSSFLTGYQSDNVNIGMLNATPYHSPNNPQLQSQTLVQWMIPDIGIHQPLTLIGVPSGTNMLSGNVVYITPYAPQGGYAVWTGNAGIIVGNGYSLVQQSPTPVPPPPGPVPNQNQFYVAFTVQLSNGVWATVVDPNPIPANAQLNGKPSADLMMVAGTYNESTGTLALYVNGTLVSEASLPQNLPRALNNSPLSIMDVGSVYNGTNIVLKSLPGVAGDVKTGDSATFSFDGALGPTIVYDVSLPPSAVNQLFSGYLPDFNDIVVMWTQNFVVYSKVISIYPLETVECFSNQPPQGNTGQYGNLNGHLVGYEVYNLVNENAYDGFWGLGPATPTAFTPFSALVLWSGPVPLIYNPAVLSKLGVNVSIEFQAFLTPPEKGEYLFTFNFTDCQPGITGETKGQLVWANEYAKVYINGREVFNGYMTTNKQVKVLYSDLSSAVTNNQPEFSYFFTRPVNLTILITFNVPNTYQSGQPLAVFFGLMWEPPGYQSFVPVPLNYFRSQG